MGKYRNVVTGVNENAIEGESTAGGRGVQGNGGATGMGVAGISGKSAGVRGDSVAGRGVEGWSQAAEGVFGFSQNGIGVYGEGPGTEASGARGGVGVYGKGRFRAGYFEGNVTVTKTVEAENFQLPNGDTLISTHNLAEATRNAQTATSAQIDELQKAVLQLYAIVKITPPKFT